MSARDKDARAAMDTILYSVLSGDTDPMTPAEVAHDAWDYADAMDAERAKRTEAEAPREPLFTVEHLNGAVAAARREGRDAGLDDAEVAVQLLGLEHANVIPQADIARIAREAIRRLRDKAPSPAPDVAALQAVADAAVVLALWGGLPKVPQWQPLINALDRAVPGWRTK